MCCLTCRADEEQIGATTEYKYCGLLGGCKCHRCSYCQNLGELEREYPDDPHHGGIMLCDECNAQYYEEYGGKIVSCNVEARLNHPELEKL
jgi:hypothetical protein